MSHRVDFSPEAKAHLIHLYDYIAARGGNERAMNYIERIEDCCHTLSTFPERGTSRDDLRPGLRIIGFERRVTIAFSISADTVRILGIFYGGRDIEAAFAEPERSC